MLRAAAVSGEGLALVRKFPYSGGMKITSRVTSKAQTTVPQAVRAALDVGPGDEIEYRIVKDEVVMTKARLKDRRHLRALQETLSEWSDPANDVYDDL
jgi:antitoxin PrlF